MTWGVEDETQIPGFALLRALYYTRLSKLSIVAIEHFSESGARSARKPSSAGFERTIPVRLIEFYEGSKGA